jgi:predicted nucleic-acid-binding Zn-ribbon protein
MATHNNATEALEKLIVQAPQHGASLQKMLDFHQKKYVKHDCKT